MIRNTGSRQLFCLREVWDNEVNAVYVCEDMGDGIGTRYTVWEVKDREIAKKILQKSEYECFSHRDSLCFLFPYQEPRPITSYYLSVVGPEPDSRERIWKDLVVTCMNSRVPWPVLYLMLKQEQIDLSRDGSVHLGYLLNLEEYTADATEGQCACQCAGLLLRLLRQEPSKRTDLARQLLTAKLKKKRYTGFLELLRDIQMVTRKAEKESVRKRLKREAGKRKDRAYRVLAAISIVLAVLVLIMLLMKIFFGDIALFDLFRQSVKTIGTESLLQ